MQLTPKRSEFFLVPITKNTTFEKTLKNWLNYFIPAHCIIPSLSKTMQTYCKTTHHQAQTVLRPLHSPEHPSGVPGYPYHD